MSSDIEIVVDDKIHTLEIVWINNRKYVNIGNILENVVKGKQFSLVVPKVYAETMLPNGSPCIFDVKKTNINRLNAIVHVLLQESMPIVFYTNFKTIEEAVTAIAKCNPDLKFRYTDISDTGINYKMCQYIDGKMEIINKYAALPCQNIDPLDITDSGNNIYKNTLTILGHSMDCVIELILGKIKQSDGTYSFKNILPRPPKDTPNIDQWYENNWGFSGISGYMDVGWRNVTFYTNGPAILLTKAMLEAFPEYQFDLYYSKDVGSSKIGVESGSFTCYADRIDSGTKKYYYTSRVNINSK